MVRVADYPGLIEDADGLSIEGELWQVGATCLAELDREECLDVGRFGRRPVLLEDDQPAEAYFYAGPTHNLLDCGTRW